MMQPLFEPEFSESSLRFSPRTQRAPSGGRRAALRSRREAMGRGFGLGEVLRPGQPRRADGTSSAPREGQTGVEADAALSGSGTDGRRGGKRANGGDAARRAAVAVAVEHPADRSGPRTRKARAWLLPLCRRLQHLRRKCTERAVGDDGDDGVSGAAIEAEGQRGQERSGATVAAEVSGLQHDVAPGAEADGSRNQAESDLRRKCARC